MPYALSSSDAYEGPHKRQSILFFSFSFVCLFGEDESTAVFNMCILNAWIRFALKEVYHHLWKLFVFPMYTSFSVYISSRSQISSNESGMPRKWCVVNAVLIEQNHYYVLLFHSPKPETLMLFCSPIIDNEQRAYSVLHFCNSSMVQLSSQSIYEFEKWSRKLGLFQELVGQFCFESLNCILTHIENNENFTTRHICTMHIRRNHKDKLFSMTN